MSFKVNYVKEVEDYLSTPRFDGDLMVTLSQHESKYRKYKDKFNDAIKHVYDKYKERGSLMYHIALSLQKTFDIEWLIDELLNDDNKTIITKELSEAYSIKPPSKNNKKTEDKEDD